MSKPDWVPVRSQDELRPGVMVRLSCFYGNGFRVDLLTGRTGCPHNDGDTPCKTDAWTYRGIAPCCQGCQLASARNGDRLCLVQAARNGRLYRLSDLDDTASATTADNETRARETAGGRGR